MIDYRETSERDAPGLKSIQIDDGYQPAMGDWLETGAAFGGNVRGVFQQIRERGFEPAICPLHRGRKLARIPGISALVHERRRWKAAEFEDESLRIGAIQLENARMVFLFNWGDAPQTVDMRRKAAELFDFWSGESPGRHEGGFTVKDMPRRSAIFFLFKAAGAGR